MASPDHSELLKGGVAEWNEWRAAGGVVPQLARADLRGCDLRLANLAGADLFRADLTGAQLYRADLSGSVLTEANLAGAILHEAELSGADLTSASMQGAVLSEARLRSALLFRANLRGANCRAAQFQLASLRAASMVRANLIGAGFGGADLSGADLAKADLFEADLSAAKIAGASLSDANLSDADLSHSSLLEANLSGANLSRSKLVGSILRRSNLSNARLVDCDCRGVDLRGSRVYGVSVWNVQLEDALQENLTITPPDEASITLDNVEVAQFIYLLLNNARVRDVIDTFTTKVVLILGRFTPERKPVLDRLREEIRRHNYLPVLFDFDKPASRSFTETVATLAHMARFIIADITEPRSIPQELQRVAPDVPSVPIQLIIQEGFAEWGMLPDLFDYPWVLRPHRYAGIDQLLAELSTHVIAPAERMAEDIARRRVGLAQP